MRQLGHLLGKRLVKTYLTYLGRVIHKGEIVMRYLPHLPGKRLLKDLPHLPGKRMVKYLPHLPGNTWVCSILSIYYYTTILL